MKKALLVVISLFLLLFISCGNNSSETYSNETEDETYSYQSENEYDTTINWSDASEYEGETVNVIGTVTSVHYGNPTFINIGNDYPNPNRFQAIIWDDDIGNFTYDLNELVGHTISVYGEVLIYDYDDYSVPEIVLTDQDAITY